MKKSTHTVVIPEWKRSYDFSKSTKAKYWEWKDKDKLPKKYADVLYRTPVKLGSKLYCCNSSKELFIKNSGKVGKPNSWVLNGQALYNAILNWRQRKIIAAEYHSYFATYIKEQLKPIELKEGEALSISCDIYELPRPKLPDVSNMWLLEKFFEDALQECGIIPDDSPKYVIESGRKRYHWVTDESERKLVFTLNIIKV